jgi:CDP-glucose 4,6-dehydratase
MENLGIRNNFWNNKKVLITGHTGFKGAWLTFWLLKMGAIVKGISLPPDTNPNLYLLLDIEKNMDSKFGDIRNLDFLKKEVKSFKPDIVFHLAAQALVRNSYDNPIETFQTNVMGTANILEVIRYVDTVRSIVCITSDKCYENREWPWQYRESDALGGWDPYSASKGCSELVISSYRKSFYHPHSYQKHGVGLASARAGNVIGGGDWGDNRLIPDMVRSFFSGEPVLIRNPKATRPWQHVLDLLNGYLLLAEKLYEDGAENADAWNFGPLVNDAKDVLTIVEYIIKLWGDGASFEYDKLKHPHEAYSLKLDSSKAQQMLGWYPVLTLDKSLEWVVEWYKNYKNNKEESQKISELQLKRFEKLLKDNSDNDSKLK